MATKYGMVKKTAVAAFKNLRRNGLIAIKLRKGDSLRKVQKIGGNEEIILVSRRAKSIRFRESDVRAMSRPASGLRGIRLSRNDELIGMEVIREKPVEAGRKKVRAKKHLLAISEKGYGKRTKISEYRLQKRGGMGVKTAEITEKTGVLAAAKLLEGTEKYLIAISQKGQVIKLSIASISKMGRAT
jgi:DNA gyrase subunit A